MISAITLSASQVVLIKLCALAFVLSGLLWQDGVGRWGRGLYWLAAAAVAVLACADLAVMMRARIDMNVEWDFLNYWLAGRIAAEDLPIYEAASYLRQPLPFWPSRDFFSEVIFVGTLYAPPAVLLFLPLGYFEYREAFVLWSLVQAILLVPVALLLKLEFFRGERGNRQVTAWLVVICLAVFFAPVKENLYAGQINIIMALLFTLVWRFRSKAVAGIWIGLGMCVKPYFGILLLWLFLRYRIGTMVLAATTIVLAFACAAILFGASDVTTYFVDNPLASAPAHLYTQDVNLSVLAVLRRVTGATQWTGSPFMHGPYIITVMLLTVMTAWSVLRCADDRWALTTCLALGLLIAPQSLYHYCTVLLPAITLMLVYKGFRWTSTIAVLALFAVASLKEAGFWLNLSVWLLSVSYPWWSDA